MDPAFEIKGNSVKNTQCVLMKRPVGDIKDDDLQAREKPRGLIGVNVISCLIQSRSWIAD